MMLTAMMLAAGLSFDPLDMRWTFGAHEPIGMYRRKGQRTTGGIEGSSHWVAPWLDWFDTESPKLMKELGLNWCHARYYKGLGWKAEEYDFKNVKRFVKACHENDVHVLAYVQYSTLYYETMEAEIPDLEKWACVDEHGVKRTYYGNGYYRWRQCPNCAEWEAYIKPIMVRAVTEGGFDGVMFDNAFCEPCHCDRCQRLFREHLAKLPERERWDKFGYTDMSHVRIPPANAVLPEIKDPLVAEYLLWRADGFHALFSRLRAHLKGVRPDAVFSANTQPVRRYSGWRVFGLDMTRQGPLFDIMVAQNGNYPAYDVREDRLTTRIRELKLMRELGICNVALCDNDSNLTEEQERYYILPIAEDLVLGGIPTDRTVVSPVPEPGYVSKKRIASRKPQLAALDGFVKDHRDLLSAAPWQPVRLLYTAQAAMLSDACFEGLAAAEEIAIRRHLPWGYLVTTRDELVIPADCEVIVVANQTCLSEKQIGTLVDWAKRGGKLVVTGDSGRCDEMNRQWMENPFLAKLPSAANVSVRSSVDRLVTHSKIEWVPVIPPPADGGDALAADVAKVGFRLPFSFRNLEKWVGVEYRRLADGYALHLVNYRPSVPMDGVEVVAPGYKVARLAPFGEKAPYLCFTLNRTK